MVEEREKLLRKAYVEDEWCLSLTARSLGMSQSCLSQETKRFPRLEEELKGVMKMRADVIVERGKMVYNECDRMGLQIGAITNLISILSHEQKELLERCREMNKSCWRLEYVM